MSNKPYYTKNETHALFGVGGNSNSGGANSFGITATVIESTTKRNYFRNNINSDTDGYSTEGIATSEPNPARNIISVDYLRLSFNNLPKKSTYSTMHLELLKYRHASPRRKDYHISNDAMVSIYPRGGFKSRLHQIENKDTLRVSTSAEAFGLEEDNIVSLGDYGELRPFLFPMTNHEVQTFKIGAEYYFGAAFGSEYLRDSLGLSGNNLSLLTRFPCPNGKLPREMTRKLNILQSDLYDDNLERVGVLKGTLKHISKTQSIIMGARIILDYGLETQKITPIFAKFRISASYTHLSPNMNEYDSVRDMEYASEISSYNKLGARVRIRNLF